MKTAILILAGLYLSGVFVAIVMLHKEVKELVVNPKSKIWLTWKVLKNTAPFYLSSWYGVVLIKLKRNL